MQAAFTGTNAKKRAHAYARRGTRWNAELRKYVTRTGEPNPDTLRVMKREGKPFTAGTAVALNPDKR